MGGNVFFEIFIFWYMAIIIWLVSGFSIIFFIIALIKKSQILMGISLALMLPNILLLFFQELEPILIFLFIVWFALQIFMLFRLCKHMNVNTA
ncbi:hypothetical protein SAMN05444673_7027 [Bacillus sp. OV166]|uniref:hypothetical protein n=1 Tax=Bacillus sp. OV166 TaxID=1882763 RepID=UPI000A2AC616|nr:hypothetical protein [Bacillus sp. OV166]SMQ86944.1 hypothetical protein SAMN05444673_7027 [Bacillus sp. OV166]